MEPMGGVLACITRDAGKLSFLKCAGEASGPVWARMSVVRLRDSNEMPLIGSISAISGTL